MAGRAGREALILGSGKMARDIGGFMLARGWAVTWAAGDAERIPGLEKHAARIERRIGRTSPSEAEGMVARCVVRGDRLPSAEVVIESVREDAAEKRRALAEAERFLERGALRLSNSSSVLPEELGDGVVGMHFFYPVEITSVVEVVRPSGSDRGEIECERALSLASELGLDVLLQEGRRAFAANRLLLPLQAEVLRELISGRDPSEVNECSSCRLVPIGQLDLMDSVGLDVVAPAVAAYAGRMPREEARDLEPLIGGLEVLLESGKRGKKNGDGLAAGSALPWGAARGGPNDTEELKTRLEWVFINTCLRFMEEGDATREDLDLILESIVQSEAGLDEVLASAEAAAGAKVLSAAFESTGIRYLEPCASLSSAARERIGGG